MRKTEPARGLHAHVAHDSRDCDGPGGQSWIEVLNTDELHEAALAEHARRTGGRPVNDFSDLHFKHRVLANCVSLHQDPGCVTQVEITDDGFAVHRQTDEGFSRYSVQWCEDRCDTGKRSAYDTFAEQMGY